MLFVKCTSNYKPEREYICRVLLREFLGLEYILQYEERQDWQISVDSDKKLLFPDILFQTPENKWLTPKSLSVQPLTCWDTRELEMEGLSPINRKLPVIYGDLDFPKMVSNNSDKSRTTLSLPLDIFGSSFFMLTRYEEVVKKDRDEHDRFPAWASLSYQEGFLERPIVDEYVEILWNSIHHLWPNLNRKKRRYQVYLSHDIDHPLGAADRPWPQVFRRIAGDFVKRKDFELAYRRFVAKCTGKPDFDPFNTFDLIMDMSERYKLKSTFYFKTGSSNDLFDEDYSINSLWIYGLLQHIHKRGHEIGLHTSYESFNDLNRIRSEFKILLNVVEKLKISQKKWGGRQHYLRWENPITWQIWDESGLDYDATVGFAEHAGFRCGTSHEFPVFNLKRRKTLRLRERPLILMDVTVLNKNYMHLHKKKTLEKVKYLSTFCRSFNGTFSLLWHNDNLQQSWQKKLYEKILEVILEI